MNTLKNALLVLLGMLAGVAFSEAGLRLAGHSRSYVAAYYQPDPVVGWSPKPNTEGYQRDEGAAAFRFNSDGMRDREHSIEKSPQTFRIAVLGDSFTEALQVSAEKSFCSIIERQLPNTEVLNFGVRGYGTAQELLKLRSKAWKYKPDLVVLAFFMGNDLCDNLRALSSEDPTLREMRPYFLLRDGRLVLDRAFLNANEFRTIGRLRREFVSGLKNSVMLAEILAMSFHRFLHGGDEEESARKMRAGEPLKGNLVYRPPASDDWRSAWEITELLLKEMRDEVRAHEARFGVAVLSTDIQVYPDRSVREAFERRLDISDLDYADSRLRAFCERESIPVITLAAPLRKYAESHHVYLHGFSNTILGYHHWNENGHRRAGELMAGWIRQIHPARSSQTKVDPPSRSARVNIVR